MKEKEKAAEHKLFVNRPEVVVVFGRGVEIKNLNLPDEYFCTTRLFEKWNFSDNTRYGIASKVVLNGDEPDVVVAGANSNVLGFIHYIKALSNIDSVPKQLIFSAGRPKYLRDLSDSISEGDIMYAKFKNVARNYNIPDIPTDIFRDNRTTKDDVEKTFEFVEKGGYKSVAIIAVDPHIARINKFIEKYLEFKGQSVLPFKYEVINSWEILSTVNVRYKNLFECVKKTEAFRKTSEMEQYGVADLDAGRYNFKDDA